MNEKIDKEFKEWFKQLKSAIILVGGYADNTWKDRTLEEVFKNLYPNGVFLQFVIHPAKLKNRKFTPHFIEQQDDTE